MQIWENLQFLGIAMHRRRMMKVSNYLILKHLETSEPWLLSYSPLDRPSPSNVDIENTESINTEGSSEQGADSINIDIIYKENTEEALK